MSALFGQEIRVLVCIGVSDAHQGEKTMADGTHCFSSHFNARAFHPLQHDSHVSFSMQQAL